VSATGNVLPAEVAELANAAFAGDWDRARELHYRLLALNRAIFLDTNPVPVKAMLAALGLMSADVRPPLTGLDDATAARVQEVLSRYTSQPLAA
jgi:4-hydroxy-tetrahydrodipicolinate synthase